MSIHTDTLLILHRMAQKHGDGLKPELLSLLEQRAPSTAHPLNAPLKSSGPTHHDLSTEELSARGITQVPQKRDASQNKDTTQRREGDLKTDRPMFRSRRNKPASKVL